MENSELLALLMFPTLLLFLMTGFPVAFVLSGTAIVFGILGSYWELFIGMISDLSPPESLELWITSPY